MPSILIVSLACAALACGPVDPADGSTAPIAAQQSAVADAEVEPTPPTLVEFDGGWEFLKTSRQLRVWREAVEFKLEVDATGQPTECKVIDEFRMSYVNMQLCEVLISHHSFEPARNEQNEAVPGSYRSSLSFADLREQFD